MPHKSKAARNAYRLLWTKKRRAEWFAANGPCVECETWERLQLHHKDPAQKIEHRIWNLGADRRLAELAKCEIRCFQCHVAAHKRLGRGFGRRVKPSKYLAGKDGRHRARHGINPEWLKHQPEWHSPEMALPHM